ncbi:accessory Sec system S-layer assembly protein [Bacillus solitudinis]|uniref:accessory Sec system S-layer assembly protein n=1 Tax=Bacillus solitudinis TaxID=2014074 RepID=UPI000C2320BC|nr:accessory Sec system S-layer assembly protein [Bacillus solitudinis]
MSFLKNRDNNNLKLDGKESSVSSELLGHEGSNLLDEEIYTELSFSPNWNILKEELYAFKFLNGECLPLKPNQISLSGIELRNNQLEKKLIVTTFIRSSLDVPINLPETKLVLLDDSNAVIARKQFDLSAVGEIPPRSSRPWTFEFEPKDLLKVDIPKEGWKLAFQLEHKHALDLDPSWDKILDKNAKKQLQDLVERMEVPKKGEVNFMGVQAQKKEDGALHITLLIRNGSEKNINLEQLPLQVEDATNEVVAKGSFKLDNLTVKANTSKPWTFIFPKEMATKENPDFSRWKAYAPQQ